MSLWEGSARCEPERIQSPEDKAPLCVCVGVYVYVYVICVCGVRVCVCVCVIEITNIEIYRSRKKMQKNLKLPEKENRE